MIFIQCIRDIGLSSEEMVGGQLNTIKREGKPSDNDKMPNQTPSLTCVVANEWKSARKVIAPPIES